MAADPVGAFGFTKLPTGYLHARLQREEVHRIHSTENSTSHNSQTAS
jgi:hypothetical protein